MATGWIVSIKDKRTPQHSHAQTWRCLRLCLRDDFRRRVTVNRVACRIHSSDRGTWYGCDREDCLLDPDMRTRSSTTVPVSHKTRRSLFRVSRSRQTTFCRSRIRPDSDVLQPVWVVDGPQCSFDIDAARRDLTTKAQAQLEWGVSSTLGLRVH